LEEALGLSFDRLLVMMTVPQGESTLPVRSYYCRLTMGTDPVVCLLFVIILIMCVCVFCLKHHAVDEVQV